MGYISRRRTAGWCDAVRFVVDLHPKINRLICAIKAINPLISPISRDFDWVCSRDRLWM